MAKLTFQLVEQISGIWNKLGVNQRASLLGSSFLLVFGMVALIVWSSRPDYRLLYGGLDDASAAKVIAELSGAGIPYRNGPSGQSVLVPADKVHRARMLLATKGLPREEHVGWEIFDKPNFGISDFIQRANFMRALQGELARTITEMDEVESARVMIVKPENRLLLSSAKPSTASVFVKVRNTLRESSIDAIRYLVANAVEGLAPTSVSVVDNRGKVLGENTTEDSLAGISSSQLKIRVNVESYLAKKAEDMLDAVLGPGRSIVRVSAEIDFESTTQTAEIFDPDGSVVRQSTVNDETNDSTTTDDAVGVPGVSVNANVVTNSVGGVGSTRQDARKVMTETYDISKTVSNTVKNAGGIKSVSAAVFIAAESVFTNGVSQVVVRTPAEMEKLRRVVEGALGIPDGNTVSSDARVVIEEMLFDEGVTLQDAALPLGNPYLRLAISVLEEFGYPVLGLLLLMFFWRRLRKVADAEIPVGAKVGSLEQGEGDDEGPRVLTVDAINRLANENPENLTLAIRHWLRDESTPES